MTDRVWFITGASSGFGRELAEAAIAAGDRVALAVRDPRKVEAIVTASPQHALAVPLDVTDTTAAPAAIAAAVERFGRIDVLVNNAGRGHVGALEETPESNYRELFDLHVHGPIALIRAVLPGMRAAGSGTIVNISSQGGRLSFAGISGYSTTKYAIEGLSDSLAPELAAFGIRVIIVEPGAFRTGFNGGSALWVEDQLPEYADISGPVAAGLRAGDGDQPGDPARAAAAIVTAVASDDPPRRLALGSDAVGALTGMLTEELAELERWRALSESADFPRDD